MIQTRRATSMASFWEKKIQKKKNYSLKKYIGRHNALVNGNCENEKTRKKVKFYLFIYLFRVI